jgi:hypothetical protein
MSNYQFSIGPHPSQARHPFTNEPLVDDDGTPVSLFPDQRTLRLDNRIIAYLSNGGISFIVPCAMLGDVVYQDALEYAKQETGDFKNVTSVPMMPETEPEEDYDE